MYRRKRSAQNDAELQAAVERDGDAEKVGVGLPRRRILRERVGVGEDVVGDEQAAWLDLPAREREPLLVVVLLRVDEHDVEDVLDLREELARIAFEQLGPFAHPGLLDIRAPRLRLARVVLEREDAAAEVPNAGGEPERRVAARAADLEHLAVGLRRDEREEEATGRRLDLPRAELPRDALFPLGRVLPLEALHDGENTVVEHLLDPILGDFMRAELTIEIARTPEEVFAYLSDVSNLPEWQSGVRSSKQIGDRIEETRSFLGREMHTTLEIIESESPRVFTLKALDGPVKFTVTHELEPADGGTRLSVVAEGDVPGFASGIVAQQAKRQFSKDFGRLKEILER